MDSQPTKIRITNGYGIELDPNFLHDNLFDYVDFNTAAPLIDRHWSRHHIFKELNGQRIWLSELIIVYNSDLVPDALGVGNKKYYISRKEVERLRKEYAKRTKRNVTRCGWCERPLQSCRRQPCSRRFAESPEHRQTVETVAEYFTRYVNKPRSRTTNFKEIGNATASKDRSTRQPGDEERTDETNGG